MRSTAAASPRRTLPAIVVLCAVVAACSAVAPTPLPASVAPRSPGPGSAAPATPTGGAVASGPTATEPAATGALTVPIDPSLLQVLPSTVAGLPVTAADPSGADDPGLVQTVERMAQGVVIDPASGDFAYASVIVLEPGVFDEAFYRSWRDSFDEGACSQAGGVSGHAQATIGGRTTFIGRCAGGVLTYHVKLERPDAIVSVSSLGSSRLGEQLVAGLRP